jgi:phosphoribosylaminoimidazole (AIR) synthetase
VFNMGVGMIVVAEASAADATVRALRDAGEHAWIMGSVERGQGVRYV